MVTVRVTETYDMKTTVGKLGIIGIHTPKGRQISRLYPGLTKNYKYIRFKKCDVVGACASVLPADPLQVGVSAGTVAPEDMFNPILYKAVSNSSFDTLVSRIYDSINTTDVIEHTGSVNEQELDATTANAFKMYYALLATNGEWRKSMPQTGFKIKSLVPIAHTLISQYGNIKKPTVGVADVLDGSTQSTTGINENLSEVPITSTDMSGMVSDAKIITPQVFRGRAVRMPRMPLHYGVEGSATEYDNVTVLPKTFVACMILPPARLHEFYYRMRVTWTVSFEKLITTNEIGSAGYIQDNGSASYGSDYSFEGSKSELPTGNDTVDTDGVDCAKIMES